MTKVATRMRSAGILEDRIQAVQRSLPYFYLAGGGPVPGIRITSLPCARVTCNVIEANLAYGLALESASGVQVYRNAFLTNTLSPQGYDDADPPNAWDNGAVGNYWTDWNNNPGYPTHYEVAPLGPPTAKDNFPLGSNPTVPGCTA